MNTLNRFTYHDDQTLLQRSYIIYPNLSTILMHDPKLTVLYMLIVVSLMRKQNSLGNNAVMLGVNMILNF
ncbi:MAG: hypothetical protein LBE70_03155 [Nitrososphaerota archaeon]|nr:hypothetical protein [Nitrososphaerota archaeon]